MEQTTPDYLSLSKIVRIARRAAQIAADNLWEYWPADDRNEMAERNQTLALAVALREHGWRFYAEAHSTAGASPHVDLLAIDPNTGSSVVAECKRLYLPDGAGKMADDVRRIREFEHRHARSEGSEQFGLLCASTWQEKIATWWSTSDCPPPSDHANWIRLKEALGSATRGSVPLQGYDAESRVADQRFHHFLYAVFRLP